MLSSVSTLALLAGLVSPILAAPVDLDSSPATPLLAKRDCTVKPDHKDFKTLLNLNSQDYPDNSVDVGTLSISVYAEYVVVNDGYTDTQVAGTQFLVTAQDCEETWCVADNSKQRGQTRRCGVPVPRHSQYAVYGGKWVGHGGTFHFRTQTIGDEPDSLSASKAQSNSGEGLIFLSGKHDKRIVCSSKKGRGKCPKPKDNGSG